jgi:hypothetical protein
MGAARPSSAAAIRALAARRGWVWRADSLGRREARDLAEVLREASRRLDAGFAGDEGAQQKLREVIEFLAAARPMVLMVEHD